MGNEICFVGGEKINLHNKQNLFKTFAFSSRAFIYSRVVKENSIINYTN